MPDAKLSRRGHCRNTVTFPISPVANNHRANRPSFHRICPTWQSRLSGALCSVEGPPCPGEYSGDIKSVAPTRATDHKDDRMRRVKFLVQTGEYADCDDLL